MRIAAELTPFTIVSTSPDASAAMARSLPNANRLAPSATTPSSPVATARAANATVCGSTVYAR